jgi:hypothetical protein
MKIKIMRSGQVSGINGQSALRNFIEQSASLWADSNSLSASRFLLVAPLPHSQEPNLTISEPAESWNSDIFQVSFFIPV